MYIKDTGVVRTLSSSLFKIHNTCKILSCRVQKPTKADKRANPLILSCTHKHRYTHKHTYKHKHRHTQSHLHIRTYTFATLLKSCIRDINCLGFYLEKKVDNVFFLISRHKTMTKVPKL